MATDTLNEVVSLLNDRLTPQQIRTRLDLPRGNYYYQLGRLTRSGLLRPAGELPAGATAATAPSGELTAANTAAFAYLGWTPATIRQVWRDQGRYGLFPPETATGTAPRDDWQGWTGQTIRRVEWSIESDHWNRWVVQGILIPRADGKPIDRSVPPSRLVVADELVRGVTTHWIADRGLIVPLGMFRTRAGSMGDCSSPDDEVSLTLALAWVLESRALLTTEALESTTVLDGA